MTKKTKGNECRCWRCGVELNDDNCRRTTAESVSGYSHLCIDCEQAFFDTLAKVQGRYEALYITCGAFDVPCVPLALDGVDFDEMPQVWKAYLDLLDEKNLDTRNGEKVGFMHGVKSICGLFGNNLAEKDFAERIRREKGRIGTKEQRERFGALPIYKGLPMTKELYDELDRQYEIRAAEFRGQTISPQMDDTLIKVAKGNVLYDFLMRQGMVKPALDVQKGIDLLLASEEMRKKDAKKVEQFRIDSQIKALEDAGLFEDGKFLSFEDTCKEILSYARKPNKYPQTLDVADQMLLDFYNNMRRNQDLQTTADLPEDLAVQDEHNEFAEEMGDSEKKSKAYAGITEVNIVKTKKGIKK